MPRPHGGGGPGGFQTPKNLRKTIGKLMAYVGRSKWLLVVVAICLALNTVCSIGGSYLLKFLINDCIVPGDFQRLAQMLAFMAGVYICAALFSFT